MFSFGNLQEIIIAAGYAGVFVTIFAESGFLLGFFLPGDSLLFTLGILASQDFFNIYALVALCVSAAILGDNFGYWCGKKFGPAIFNRDESLLFHKKNVEKTRLFYEKYGRKAIILARFVPVVRTFVPIMAGVGQMNYMTFLRYNVIGGLLWGAGVLLAGFFLGQAFPQVQNYLLLIIIIIILTSFLPVLTEWLKHKK